LEQALPAAVLAALQERTMTKHHKDDKSTEHTSAGGHLGGTYFGQSPDAKTTSTVKDAGRKARPNDGSDRAPAAPREQFHVTRDDDEG
jgi:hypothetical protein